MKQFSRTSWWGAKHFHSCSKPKGVNEAPFSLVQSIISEHQGIPRPEMLTLLWWWVKATVTWCDNDSDTGRMVELPYLTQVPFRIEALVVKIVGTNGSQMCPGFPTAFRNCSWQKGAASFGVPSPCFSSSFSPNSSYPITDQCRSKMPAPSSQTEPTVKGHLCSRLTVGSAESSLSGHLSPASLFA